LRTDEVLSASAVLISSGVRLLSPGIQLFNGSLDLVGWVVGPSLEEEPTELTGSEPANLPPPWTGPGASK